MRLAAALLCAPLLLASCTSSDDAPAGPELPAESAFAQGICRDAAPDLLELGRTVPQLGDDSVVAPEVQQGLADVQERLALFVEAADPPVGPLLATLVERIGGVRIRAVGNSYDPGLGEDLQAAYDDVLAACTSA